MAADATRLLAGALSEAKYVALFKGKIFNANVVYLDALKFYGGQSVMATIERYQSCFQLDQNGRQRKQAELFLAAYALISHPGHWQAIDGLAAYMAKSLYLSPSLIVDCEEVDDFLMPRVAA